MYVTMVRFCRPLSVDRRDRSLDRPIESLPSRARDRSWPIVTRRQSLPSIPTPRPLVRPAARRASRDAARAAGVASLARAASWVRLVRFDAMRCARERERGTGRGRACSRVASRRVRRRRARAMTMAMDDYSRARGWMTSRDARGDRPRAMGRWWTRANARGGRGAVDAVEEK